MVLWVAGNSKFCREYNEPVIVTRNRKIDLAIMNIGIEEITGIRSLLNLLEEADNEIESGSFLTEGETDKK